MHVVVVAAERAHEDEKKRRFFSPALPGQLSKDVQGFLDVVGYLRAGKAADGQGALTRRLYIQPDDRYDAKCRIDRKSTRLNSSHVANSYAVFCSKKNMERQ